MHCECTVICDKERTQSGKRALDPPLHVTLLDDSGYYRLHPNSSPLGRIRIANKNMGNRNLRKHKA